MVDTEPGEDEADPNQPYRRTMTIEYEIETEINDTIVPITIRLRRQGEETETWVSAEDGAAPVAGIRDAGIELSRPVEIAGEERTTVPLDESTRDAVAGDWHLIGHETYGIHPDLDREFRQMINEPEPESEEITTTMYRGEVVDPDSSEE